MLAVRLVRLIESHSDVLSQTLLQKFRPILSAATCARSRKKSKWSARMRSTATSVIGC
jgi:hypothetical protein